MSDEPRVLPFPSGEDDDAVLAAQVAAMYRGYPARTPADAERCTHAVLSEIAAGSSVAAGSSLRRRAPRGRWWWGAAAAAVLVVVTMRPWRPDVSSEADSAFSVAAREATAPLGTITPLLGGDSVRFDLRLPRETKDVALVGDFNGWDESATPMLRQNGDGTWSAQVELSPGRHVYAFVVDGQQWLIDPLAPQVPDAGFGPANAVVIDGPR